MPECETIVWIDPEGVDVLLTEDPEVLAAEGIAGRGMPPVRFTDEVVPLQPGTRLRIVEHDAREVAVPIAVVGETIAAARLTLEGLLRKFDPTRGDGTLRVTRLDGVQRDLVCRYIGGAEIVEAPADRAITVQGAAQRFVAVFRAFDTYWYDVDAYEAEYAVAMPVDATFLPIPNATTGSFVTLVEAEVVTSPHIVLDTDVDAQSWPIWTITGPASDVVLTNDTTGDVIDLTNGAGLVIAGGDVVTIDTRPGHKTIRLDDGTNLMPYLTPGSRLWPLGPEQDVTISVSGADEDTRVTLEVRTAHLTV